MAQGNAVDIIQTILEHAVNRGSDHFCENTRHIRSDWNADRLSVLSVSDQEISTVEEHRSRLNAAVCF